MNKANDPAGELSMQEPATTNTKQRFWSVWVLSWGFTDQSAHCLASSGVCEMWCMVLSAVPDAAYNTVDSCPSAAVPLSAVHAYSSDMCVPACLPACPCPILLPHPASLPAFLPHPTTTGQPWGEWNEWIDVLALNGPSGQYGDLSSLGRGQYGDLNAVGGYSFASSEASPGGYGSRVSIASLGSSLGSSLSLGARGLDTVGADTKGSDTKGSDTRGSDTKGSDTRGSDPVGASTSAISSSKGAVPESGKSVSGSVGGVYEDPTDFSTSRKLLRKLLQTVSLGTINVDVSQAAGKTAVNVAAPFTGVSVRKEAGASATAAASASVNTRALKQIIVDVGNLVHVDVAKLAAAGERRSSAEAVNVLAPFTNVAVRKEEGAAASPSSSNRRLLDDAKMSAAAQEEEEAEQVRRVSVLGFGRERRGLVHA
jgi:hypothetical protein